jgi:dTDP-4-dehydrorhamnose reductase
VAAMKILVTGAKGMLGSDLVPVLKADGNAVVATDIEELDITNPDQVTDFVYVEKPDLVINCAAYTQVDEAESEPEEAFLINGKGTENIALTCRELGIDLCYLSTDYVFNGEKTGPYTPEDKTDPINTYGASKLAGENAIQQVWDRFYIVRTSWLYGKNGKNFVNTILNLANRQKEIRVVDDQTGSPTWTVSLAHVLSKLIRTGKYGIYHATDETDRGISWHRFAEEIVRVAHLDCRVIPVKSSEFPRPAKRPINSVLDLKYVKMVLNQELPIWKDSVKKFLQYQIIE